MNVLDASKLTDLAAAWVKAGWRVVAPVVQDGVVRLAEWKPGQAIETGSFPVNSAKDFLFPRSEIIARAKLDDDSFAMADVHPEATRTILLGVRPCDASALACLDIVFDWDYKDEFYDKRREATTVVTLACTTADDQCFCTTVGGAPDAPNGADAICRSADGGKTLVLEPLTDKGKALVEAAGGVIREAEAKLDPPAQLEPRFDPEAVTEWCKDNFDSPLWEQVSLPCLGCGACAYACPTCHCFDIQDEGNRSESVRLRNWDSCGFGLFTLHTSGHNPRATQAARWRQRVLHKFCYFPERFGRLACTGCGRCARLCGAGQAISEVCQAIDQARKAPAL